MGFPRGPRPRRRCRRPLQECPEANLGSAFHFVVAVPPLTLPPPPPHSQVRHNYHPECETAVDVHVQLQLSASHLTRAMALHFDRNYVALKGFARYFLKRSLIERERAEKMARMQNQRGGRIKLCQVLAPQPSHWDSGLHAMESAFQLAKRINQSFLDLHQLATVRDDPELRHFLETHYLHQQVQHLKELGDYLTNLRRMGSQDSRMAEYLFDKLCLHCSY